MNSEQISLVRLGAWVCLVLMLISCSKEPGMTDSQPLTAWSSVVVGVADMDAANSLWIDAFGMEVVTTKEGPDAALAELWGIDAADIARQQLLRSPDETYGMLHLVEFVNPDPPVREGANTFDMCPKNLDIYVHDMPERVAELREAGFSFRNEAFSEAKAPDGTAFREMHMPSHDSINVVLLEVLGADRASAERPYRAIGPLIYIVGDATTEKEFVGSIMQFDMLNDNVLGGPEIEEMVGLPPGAKLDVSIWGTPGQPLGQMEIIDYRGVDGNDLYARAKPKATGVLHLRFNTNDLQPVLDRLASRDWPITDHGSTSTLHGEGRMISFITPAGLRIEILEI